MSGRSLLVASSALVAGCGGGSVVGNLVAPPMYELCVTVVPAEAEVTIDQQPLEEDGCNTTWEGPHAVAATADGYVPYEAEVQLSADTTHDITMTAAR
jgi:hypothetical protein